jgi:hypothetical protein
MRFALAQFLQSVTFLQYRTGCFLHSYSKKTKMHATSTSEYSSTPAQLGYIGMALEMEDVVPIFGFWWYLKVPIRPNKSSKWEAMQSVHSRLSCYRPHTCRNAAWDLLTSKTNKDLCNFWLDEALANPVSTFLNIGLSSIWPHKWWRCIPLCPKVL